MDARSTLIPLRPRSRPLLYRAPFVILIPRHHWSSVPHSCCVVLAALAVKPSFSKYPACQLSPGEEIQSRLTG